MFFPPILFDPAPSQQHKTHLVGGFRPIIHKFIYFIISMRFKDMGSGREGGSCTNIRDHRPPHHHPRHHPSNRTPSTCNKADSPTIQPPSSTTVANQRKEIRIRGAAASHPGGAWQIELSAGWDVTNLVQSYHDLTPAFFKRIKLYAVGTTEGRTAHSVTLKENVASSGSCRILT